MEERELGGFSRAIDSLYDKKLTWKTMLAVPFHEGTPLNKPLLEMKQYCNTRPDGAKSVPLQGMAELEMAKTARCAGRRIKPFKNVTLAGVENAPGTRLK
jgi:hypothetical protein